MSQPAEITDASAIPKRWTPSSSELIQLNEVQSLRQELVETQQKLLGYADKVISLYDELQTIKATICESCKRKVASNTTRASSQAALVPSSSFSHIPLPDTSESVRPTTFWRRMLKVNKRPVSNDSSYHSGSFTPNIHTGTVAVDAIPLHAFPPSEPSDSGSLLSHISGALRPSITEKSLTVSGSVPVRSSESLSPSKVPSAHFPRWSVKYAATVKPTISVTFVCSFIHPHWAAHVRFSSDGRYIVTGLGGGKVLIYDVESRKKICELAEHASQYSSEERLGAKCVCFSPNGKFIVVGDTAGRVIVWNVSRKRIRNIFRGDCLSIESVDFSPDGQLLASASREKTVRVWNMRDGSAKVFTDNAEEFWSVRFSPNGQYIAAGNTDGILRVWDVRHCRLIEKWIGHEGGIRSVAFTPDGRGLLTGGSDMKVKFWDVGSLGTVRSGGELIRTNILEYKGHTDHLNWIAISPDGQWVGCASDDNSVILWDALTAVRQCTLIGYNNWVRSVDFSPQGTYLATSDDDGHVTLWRYHRV